MPGPIAALICGLACLILGAGIQRLQPTAFAQPAYDVLIKNGRVLDGTGNPWRQRDVAITGDRIAAIGDLPDATANRVIDATGLYVAPGFIDVHSHAGPGLATEALSGAVPLLAQGVTTVIVNPDGGGPVDLVEQRARLEAHGLGVNVGLLVPHGSIRRHVIGMADRAATDDELRAMRVLVRAGMEAGAFGLSSGLFYAPASYASTEELIALAETAAAYDGVYTSHIRDESNYSIGVVAAVDEVIRIAREAGLPGVVTHIKALGPPVWGYAMALVHRIEQARAEGVEVYADQYPYTASATSLVAALVPRWAEAGGRDSLLARLDDPAVLPRIRAGMAENLDRRGGPGRIQFRTFSPDTSLEGRTLTDVANARNQPPLDAAIDLIRQANAGIVSFNMSEADVHLLMQQPWTMTASDGDLVPMGVGVPHPRGYGTFPRKLRTYVIEDQRVTLPEAIRSMTSLPAQVFRLPDRGLLRPGSAADVVVFDLNAVRDPADFQRPHQLAEGMRFVFVNGSLAWQTDHPTGSLAGRVLFHRSGE